MVVPVRLMDELTIFSIEVKSKGSQAAAPMIIGKTAALTSKKTSAGEKPVRVVMSGYPAWAIH